MMAADVITVNTVATRVALIVIVAIVILIVRVAFAGAVGLCRIIIGFGIRHI